VITNIFGFKAWEAWAQLQSTGQLVIVVDAGSRHLVELRSIIYPLLRIRDAPVHHGALSSGYAMIAETEVLFERVIGDSRVLDDILEMTPHGHKITPSARAAMPSVGALSLTLHALIRVFRRT
jgi:23S rRNA (guanine745-N1)-methyltransferase